MKQIALYCLLVFNLLINNLTVLAEGNTKSFDFLIPEKKISNSLYNSFRTIDSRPDTIDLGFVQTGIFNSKAKVVTKGTLAYELQQLFAGTIDSSAKDGEMLLQIRQMKFAEITGALSEKGFFNFNAVLYQKDGDKYKKLGTIDTTLVVKAMDVTRSLLKCGSHVVSEFIENNLHQTSNDTELFSYNQVLIMDYIEKQKIKLYTTPQFSDGLYYTYESFKEQNPEKEAKVETKGVKISSVKGLNKDNKLVKIKSKEVYALVHQGVPYIATEYGFYRLTKSNDDFFCKGKAKKTANSADVAAASIMFGAIGGAIAAANSNGTYEMKIDYRTGELIKLKEIIDSQE